MMNRYWIGAFLCVMVLTCPILVQAAPSATPPGSFIERTVSNPEDLARQIETDKLVGQRFARHFGMSVKDLADYIRKNLRISQLKSSGKFTTYYISHGDRVRVQTKTFKAGRRVFVGPDGKPVLDAVCGNPLVKGLPKIVVKVEPEQAVVQPPPAPVTPEPVKPEPPPVVAELPTTVPPVEPPVQEVPPMAQDLNVPEPQVEVLNLPPVEFSSAASLLSSGIIPGLLTAAAASVVLDGGGNPPVPEPTGLLVLGSSFSMLAAGFGVRRKCRRSK